MSVDASIEEVELHDAALLRAVHAYGSGNWELIGDELPSLSTLLIPMRYSSARACHERAAAPPLRSRGQWRARWGRIDRCC